MVAATDEDGDGMALACAGVVLGFALDLPPVLCALGSRPMTPEGVPLEVKVEAGDVDASGPRE